MILLYNYIRSLNIQNIIIKVQEIKKKFFLKVQSILKIDIDRLLGKDKKDEVEKMVF